MNKKLGINQDLADIENSEDDSIDEFGIFD